MKQGAGLLVRRTAVLTCLPLLFTLVLARQGSAQATATGVSGPALPKADIFLGYSAYYPFASDINNYFYRHTNTGATAGVAFYFNHLLGIKAEGTFFPKASNDNDCVFTAQAGPIVRRGFGHFVGSLDLLAGGAEIGGPLNQPCKVWGYGITTGVALDYVLPIPHERLALRPIQLDFMHSHINNGTGPDPTADGIGKPNAFRYSGGFVLRLGLSETPAPDASLTCVAEPGAVFPGEPIVVTASVRNLHSRHPLHYAWTTSGGTISGTEAIESLATSGLAPGEYVLASRLTEARNPRDLASCTTTFTVKALPPPTLSCAADRAAVHPGDSVTFLAVADSPLGRPLSFSFTTSAGSISSEGPRATLATSGVDPGTVSVVCKVADDRGQSATALASTLIEAPVPAQPAAMPQRLCPLSFERDRKRPVRVDNEAKSCLDEIALTLARDISSRLLLDGLYAPGESRNDGGERALNAAQYLTDEKGIDPARILLHSRQGETRTVLAQLLPPGAATPGNAGDSIAPAEITRHGEAYGGRKPQRR